MNELKAVGIVATELTYFLIEETDYPDLFGDKFKGFKIVAEATLGVAKGYRSATSEVNAQIPSTVLTQRRRLMLHTTTPPWKWARRNPHQPNHPEANPPRKLRLLRRRRRRLRGNDDYHHYRRRRWYY